MKKDHEPTPTVQTAGSGDFLEEVLRKESWSQRDLASVLADPFQAVNARYRRQEGDYR